MKLYLGEALGLLLKTLPFLWVRLGTYSLLGIGLALYFAVAAGIAWLLGQLLALLGVVVFLIAIGGAWGIVRWATRYFFYLLKAAHTAVMTEFIAYGHGPEGSQLNYGRRQVAERFRDTSIMFAVDQIVDGIVKVFNRRFARIANILPIPGIDSLMAMVEKVSTFATTYVDEAVLSRAYRHREANVWKVAQDGVILYAQAWKPILLNAVVLTLINYLAFVVFLVILAIPAVLLGALVPALKVFLGVCVVLGAWMLKLALGDAFSLAATLIAYHRATENLEPDPEWQARLEQVSDKFKKLRDRAMAAASNEPENINDLDTDLGDINA